MRSTGQAYFLAQPDGTKREGPRLKRLPVAQNRHVGAASPDFHQQGRAVIQLRDAPYRLQDRRIGKAVLFRAVDDLHIQAGIHQDTIQESVAVRGLPYGTGGHGSIAGDAVAVHHLFEVAKQRASSPNRLLAQVAFSKGVFS